MKIALCMVFLACTLLGVADSATSAEPGKEPEGATSSPPAATTPTPAAPPKAERKPSPDRVKEIEARGAEYFAQCMKDWDPATHMTKEEWARTCRRVRDDRVKFLLKQAE
jgi:hypothetical protein